MQVLPFMPSLEFYPRNSLLIVASFFYCRNRFFFNLFFRAGSDSVKEERRRLRRVVLDRIGTGITLLGRSRILPAPASRRGWGKPHG